MKHVAIYLRVSSKQQDTASQEVDLKRWVAAQPEGAAVQWYQDKFTGKKMDRPGFNRLIAAIQAGEVSTVVVWRLDRLGRTARGLVSLLDDWSTAKINVVSMREGLDLSTPAGRLMCNVLASVAAYETEIRAERVSAGQAVARANGKRWGGSEAGRLLHLKTEQVQLIKRMNAEGESVSCISRAVGVSRPTVYRLIRS